MPPPGPDRAAAEKNAYRPDIDGLRAVAVLSVLFYHAGLQPFSGGFVGVDIFFVISGFLITSIIVDDIAKDRFTVARFYERRVRRIFPALYLTVALTLAGALALFTATDLQRLFKSLAWLAAFASNIYFADNSGYFDAAAEQNAILQTWSLAIEEQFYVVFPLLLALLARQRRVETKWVLLTLAGLSLAYSIYVVDRDARSAFFSTPARVWELMLGALAAVGLYPRLDDETIRSAVAVTGAVLILGSIVLLSTDTPFPGLYALPACCGTAALIWAGACGETPVGRWLSLRPMVFVGLISYSLYLLHWPLLSLARYWAQGELSLAMTWAMLALAFAGAWASWRFVETPFRRPAKPAPRRVLFASAVTLMIALAAGGVVGARWQSGRYTTAEKFIEAEKARSMAERCMLRDTQTFADWPADLCRVAGSGQTIAVWGNSFAAHYFDAFRDLARRSGTGLLLLAESSCPPIAGLLVPNRPGCASFNQGAMSLLASAKPATVIVSADWMVYEKKKTMAEMFEDKFALFEKTVDTLRTGGSRVVVIGPSPMFPAPVAQIAADDTAGKNVAKASYSRKYDQFFRRLAANGKIAYVPAYEVFCTEAAICRYREDEDLLFWDTGHMTARGSTMVVRKLLREVDGVSPAASN